MTAERVFDVLVVGAGPAGIAAAYAAKQCGLTYVVLEGARIAQTVCDYPLAKPLHSPAQDVELLWGELYSSQQPNATREEVLIHYYEFAGRQHQLQIRESQRVTGLERAAQGFRVIAQKGVDELTYLARKVILATGGFGVPRRLNVPGEAPGRVSYRFVEGRPYAGQEVLVVGGGNSAAEAALWLHEAKAKVTLSLRRASFASRDGNKDGFTGVKSFNSTKLEALAARGELRIVFESIVTEITPDAVLLAVRGREAPQAVSCAHVFALIGGDPDLFLLREVGAQVAEDGRPVYDRQTYETTVPGLYVAGHMTRELHMANAILMAPKIVRRMAGELPSERGAGVASDLFARVAKALRKRSELARRIVRDQPWVRRVVQAADAANTLRIRRSLARRLAKRYPLLRQAHRLVLQRAKA